jgi:hypothetical protein
VACWLAFFYLHPALLTKVGVGHFRIEIAPERFREVWFLDTLAILAANDAVTIGSDPYVANRLDYLKRPHVYGPAWLYLRHLGLTRANTLNVGLALGMAFITTAVLFLRPQCPRSLLWYIAVLCTTPILTAIERGNNDLVVFLILMPVVPCLFSEHKLVRWLALPLITLATALKYYPACAGLVLLANAGAREVRWRVVAAVVAFAAVALHVAANVPTLELLPEPLGVFTFGAISVFRELGVNGFGPKAVIMGVALAAILFWWRSPLLRDWRPDAALRREWTYFILGSVLLTGCFFVGQHFAYRWIFVIWMAPLLWSLPRDSQAPTPVRFFARVTAWLLLVMLWAEALSAFSLNQWAPDVVIPALHWVALAMQPFTWAFYLCLLGFLVHFTRLALTETFGNSNSLLSLA